MQCHRHPDRPGVGRTDPLGGPLFHCVECWQKIRMAPGQQIGNRAYGTGLGPQAHTEAQEARRYAAEWERHKASYRETWRK